MLSSLRSGFWTADSVCETGFVEEFFTTLRVIPDAALLDDRLDSFTSVYGEETTRPSSISISTRNAQVAGPLFLTTYGRKQLYVFPTVLTV